MKAKYFKIMGVAASLLTLVAASMASGASWTWFYQPKTPKCLK